MAKVYKRPIYRVTCWRCRTISDFTHDDLEYTKYGGYSEYWKEYVDCPVCNASTVLVDHNRSGNTETYYESDPLVEVFYDTNEGSAGEPEPEE